MSLVGDSADSHAILGLVIVSLDGELESYAPDHLKDFKAKTLRCIAELFSVDAKRLEIRLLSGGASSMKVFSTQMQPPRQSALLDKGN